MSLYEPSRRACVRPRTRRVYQQGVPGLGWPEVVSCLFGVITIQSSLESQRYPYFASDLLIARAGLIRKVSEYLYKQLEMRNLAQVV